MGTRFSARPDRPWGPPNLLYNGYRLFPGGKVRPGRAADRSPPFSAAIMEEYSYTCTHPLGHTGPVTGTLYLYLSIISSSGHERIFNHTPFHGIIFCTYYTCVVQLFGHLPNSTVGRPMRCTVRFLTLSSTPLPKLMETC